MSDQRCPSWPRCGCIVRGTLMDCCRQTSVRKTPRTHTPNALDYLQAAAKTFKERNAQYGSNYQHFGELLIALFPPGGVPRCRTPAEAQRLDYIIMIAGKLQRYAYAFKRGGHADSARDIMVYAAMLEEFTSNVEIKVEL